VSTRDAQCSSDDPREAPPPLDQPEDPGSPGEPRPPSAPVDEDLAERRADRAGEDSPEIGASGAGSLRDLIASLQGSGGSPEASPGSGWGDGDEFRDPTRPLEPSPRATGLFEQRDLTKWAEDLQAQRLLLLHCADRDAAAYAAHAVMAEPRFGRFEKRELDLQALRDEEDVVRADVLLDSRVGHSGVGARLDGSLILIDVGCQESLGMFDSWTTTPSRLDDVLRRLGRLRRYLVLFGPSSSPTVEDLRRDHSLQPFPMRKVPFLDAFLRRHYPDRYAEVRARLAAEVRAGTWGKSDEEACARIKDAHETGTLLRPEPEGAWPEPATIKAENVLDLASVLDRTVLFAVSHFPGLPFEELDRVVRCLLRMREVDEGTADPPAPTAAGGERASNERPRAVDEWDDDPVKVMDRCSIRCAEPTNDPRSPGLPAAPAEAMGVWIVPRTLAEAVKAAFWRRYRPFLARYHAALHASGLLFDSSARIARFLGTLTTDLAAATPSVYNGMSIIEAVSQAAEGAVSPGLLGQRLALLLREGLRHAHGAAMAREIVTELMRRRWYPAVLDVAWRLRDAPGFDELHWIRRLLEESPADVRHRCRRQLKARVLGNEAGAATVLERIMEWCPRPGTGMRAGSAASTSLEIGVELAWDCLRGRGTPGRAQADHRHPIGVGASLWDAVAEHVPRWLLHPDLEGVVLRDLRGRHVVWLIERWLVPEVLVVEAPPAADHLWECLVDRWVAAFAGETPRSVGLSVSPNDGAEFFPALLLADWAFVDGFGAAGGSDPDVAPDLPRFLDEARSVIEPDRTSRLAAHWAVLRLSVEETLAALERAAILTGRGRAPAWRAASAGLRKKGVAVHWLRRTWTARPALERSHEGGQEQA